MDITVYITDLLAQKGTLVVPGLGTFYRSRTEGFYNKEKQLFYPPSVQIHFKNETTDDDSLALYLAKQRSISAASARYFIEKYVTGLKYQATQQNIEFGGLGVFSTKRNQLVFIANQSGETDELFYGLAPVQLKRNNSFKTPVIQVSVEQPPLAEVKPATPEPTLTPEPKLQAEPLPEQEPGEPARPLTIADTLAAQKLDKPTVLHTLTKPELVVANAEADEEQPVPERRKMSPLLIVSFVIIFIGLCLIVAYTLKPALFDRFLYFNAPKPVVVQKAKTDTLADSTNKDSNTTTTASNAKTTPAAANTSTVTQPDTFGIVVASFKTYTKANLGTKVYIKQGMPATVHKQPGKAMFQVSIATYFNLDSAKARRVVLMQQLKLPPQDISVQKYPYSKP